MKTTAPPIGVPAATVHRPPRRRGLAVALVGPDGAGKSTVCALLEASPQLPFPVKRIYMGVNLEASSLMLPTTRALLLYKRLRGRRPDLVASSATGTPAGSSPAPARNHAVKNAARLTVWVTEEWLRQLVATWYRTQGYVVVFDRHFFADYYHSDVASSPAGMELSARLHGWMLDTLYPKPDLVVCLDAPAEVLYARKQEASPEWLAARREQYLALADVVPAFVRVDATQPLDAVLDQVVEQIRAAHESRSA